ncbi:hypothetical protein EYZ11_007942 [Aspergillus tanneri]|uniref:Uncharacterized protein n=1 Tax=Aspergillus tanneri TaxID=1220188 RepID=A0A4S3JBP7_9EURO|nr:hypothetical protein EYZ11_007942 [Aspergillus tanneri]
MHAGKIEPNTDVVPCGPTNSTNPNVPCCPKGLYCMDQAMQDPACITRCGGRVAAYLRLWQTHDDQFPGPPPSKLATIAYISTDGTPSYATTAVTAAGNNATVTTTSSSSSSGIGVGIAAGIGVGLQDSSGAANSRSGWLSGQETPQQLMVYELGKTEPGPRELDSCQPHA